MRSLFELIFPAALIIAALAFILILRFFTHRERMAAIARGILPPGIAGGSNLVSIWLFRAGLLAVMGGLGVLLGFWFSLGRGAWLLGGFVPIGLGLGLILCHWLVEGEAPVKARENKDAATGAKERP